jgi:chromosome segregation ATPase
MSQNYQIHQYLFITKFYTKKVEEMQKKHDLQMRSLRRGDDIPAEPVVVSHDHRPEFGGIKNLDQYELAIESYKAQYDQRLSYLESELVAMTEELKKAREDVNVLEAEKNAKPNSVITADMSNTYDERQFKLEVEKEVQIRILQLKESEFRSNEATKDEKTNYFLRQLQEQQLTHSKQLEAMQERLEMIRDDRDRLQEDFQKQRIAWLEERQDAWQKVTAEEARSSQLNLELKSANDQLKQPRSPQMAQFNVLLSYQLIILFYFYFVDDGKSNCYIRAEAETT